jgi:hypothetical protein
MDHAVGYWVKHGALRAPSLTQRATRETEWIRVPNKLAFLWRVPQREWVNTNSLGQVSFMLPIWTAE